MIDIQKQVAYWRDSAVEDWQVATELINAGRLQVYEWLMSQLP